VKPYGDWNWISFYWLVIWFAIGFGGMEGWALSTGRPNDTLSAQVWHLEGNFGPPWTWSAVHAALAFGFIWLAFHMIDHIWH
jgi:hypothetical protein